MTAACEKVRTDAALRVQLHPNGKAIEGEWDPVFAPIEACHPLHRDRAQASEPSGP